MTESSSLERAFDTQWKRLAPHAPTPVAQCLFHQTREWRWDRAWIDHMVLLDLQGGGWNHGAHSREQGMANDYAKHNAAVSAGWRPIYASSSMIENDPDSVINCILELLKQPVLWQDSEYQQWNARVRNLTKRGTTISNNGITIERDKGTRFNVVLGKGNYAVGGGKTLLRQAQEQVLDLILRGVSPAATPKRLQMRPAPDLNVQLAIF